MNACVSGRYGNGKILALEEMKLDVFFSVLHASKVDCIKEEEKPLSP